MSAVKLCFFQMLGAMRRDMMLLAACAAPLLAGVAFRFGIPVLETALRGWLHLPMVISPYYELLDVFYAMLSPLMFCFVSAMVCLEEVDDRTATYLSVTPLGKTGYLAARFGLPGAAAFVLTAALLPLFKLTPLSVTEILLLALNGTLQGILIALLILTLSSNKLEGMAITKLATFPVAAVLVPFFTAHPIQYIVSFLPGFWMGKAVCDKVPLYMLPALTLFALYICALFKRYLRKI